MTAFAPRASRLGGGGKDGRVFGLTLGAGTPRHEGTLESQVEKVAEADEYREPKESCRVVPGEA